jgi:hypothetical protein
MPAAMTVRERFHATMNFQPVDRLPIVEWAGWWGQTLDRWHQEGLPAELTDRYAICRHFGLDVYQQIWFPTLSTRMPPPAHHGAGVLANLDDYHRLREYICQDRDGWPVDEAFWRAWAAQQQRGEVALWFTLDGFFWYPRKLLGIERHLYAFYDQPELMHQLNEDLVQWMIRVTDRLCAICTPDYMTFGEDMSYNHGPMLSEAQFDEFLLPYYRRIVPRLRERGIRCIIDSDGDITIPAAWFERAGLEGILPLERQAGVDVALLRQRHPRMLFIGCYDKMVMNQGEAAMRREFERLLPVAQGGGLIISCDHQTPPGVSYQDYQLYLKLFREYAHRR